MATGNFIGARNYWLLDIACSSIADAYGEWVFLVGSSLTKPDYRDVDVRLILPDEKFVELFPKGGGPLDPRWVLTNLSLTMWLENRTQLPIDFQVQYMTMANEMYDGRREPLGLRVRDREYR